MEESKGRRSRWKNTKLENLGRKKHVWPDFLIEISETDSPSLDTLANNRHLNIIRGWHDIWKMTGRLYTDFVAKITLEEKSSRGESAQKEAIWGQ